MTSEILPEEKSILIWYKKYIVLPAWLNILVADMTDYLQEVHQAGTIEPIS